MDEFKPGSWKNIFPEIGFAVFFGKNKPQILRKKFTLKRFSFALEHDSRSLRLSNSLHSRFST